MVSRTSEVRRVLIKTFFLNETSAFIKISWGYATGSVGILSDGFHSLFDGVSNIAGLIGIKLSSMPPDKGHPYGHRKFETLFAAGVSFLIFITCLEVLRRVYGSLFFEHKVSAVIESFAVIGITMLLNILTARYEYKKARELKSEFLHADAMHTKSDLLASSGVLAGLALTRLGFQHADAWAGILVALLIARTGYRILKRTAGVLVDSTSMDTEAICLAVLSVEGVRNCHNVRTRGGNDNVYVDLHIQLSPDISLMEAHDITHRVQDMIRESFPEVADIIVHTEPEGHPYKQV